MSCRLYGTIVSYLLPYVDICGRQMWKTVYYKGQNWLRNWPRVWTWFLYLSLAFIVCFCYGWKEEKQGEASPGDVELSRVNGLSKWNLLLNLIQLDFPLERVCTELSVWHVSLPWHFLAWNSDISGLKLETSFLLDFLIQYSAPSPHPAFQGTLGPQGLKAQPSGNCRPVPLWYMFVY